MEFVATRELQRAPLVLTHLPSPPSTTGLLRSPASASMLVFLQNGRGGISAKKAEVAIPNCSNHLAGIQMLHADHDMLHVSL